MIGRRTIDLGVPIELALAWVGTFAQMHGRPEAAALAAEIVAEVARDPQRPGLLRDASGVPIVELHIQCRDLLVQAVESARNAELADGTERTLSKMLDRLIKLIDPTPTMIVGTVDLSQHGKISIHDQLNRIAKLTGV